jgi:hypothetical protein
VLADVPPDATASGRGIGAPATTSLPKYDIYKSNELKAISNAGAEVTAVKAKY